MKKRLLYLLVLQLLLVLSAPILGASGAADIASASSCAASGGGCSSVNLQGLAGSIGGSSATGGGVGGDGGSDDGDGGFVGSPIDIPITSSKAVEDPPYIGGSVSGGSSSLAVPFNQSLQKGKASPKAVVKVAQKSAPKSLVGIDQPSFSLGLAVPDDGWTGKSLLACETQNDLKTMVYETSNFDVQTCHIKTMVDPEGLDDGNYHYFEYTYTMQPDEEADVGLLDKVKVRYVKDAAGNLTNYRLYGCTNSAQTLYLNYDISLTYDAADITTANLTGASIEIMSRSTLPSRLGDTGYDPTHIRELVLTGTLDPTEPTQYVTKSFSLVRTREPFNLDMDVVQTSSDILFNSYEIQGSYNVGLYSNAELFNPDDPDVDPLDYSLGSGAGTIVIPDILDPESLVECWDGTSIETTSCLISPYSNYYANIYGQTPKSSAASAATFSGDEVWDCSGTVEDTFDGDESTACDAYIPDTVYGLQPCAQQTGHMSIPEEDPAFTLSVAGISGNVTTAMSENGSTVQQAVAPTLKLTFGLPVYTPSLNYTTVKLFDMTDNCDWGTQIDLTYTDISEDDTILTLAPTLTSGHRYALVVATSVYGPTSGESSLVVTGHYTENHDSDAIYSGGPNDGEPVPLDYIVYYFSAGADQSDYAVGDEPVIFAIDDFTVTGGIAGADAACNANKPDGVTGYFRAMLVDGVDRVACVNTNNCTAGQVDWVLLPNTEYRKSCDLRVGATNASSLFDFPMDHPFSNDFGIYAYAFTGLNADWTTSANNCSGWTSSNSNLYGMSGKISQVDSGSIWGNSYGCNTTGNQLICVQEVDSSTFTIGGSISGQTGDVTLQNNAGDNILVTSVANTFQFPTSIDFGLNYAVTVLTAPAGQRCTVTNGTGTALANVSSVVVTCSAITSYKVFVTDAYVVAPTGISGADAACMAAANKPVGGSTYKAMIADGVSRRACSTDNCSGGVSENIDWVFQPTSTYKRVDGTTIGTTDSSGIFAFPLDNAFMASDAFDHGAWTGLTHTWKLFAFNCNLWTSHQGADIGFLWDAETSADSFYGSIGCDWFADLICVEQP